MPLSAKRETVELVARTEMSRTYRKIGYDRNCFRHPHTTNERRQLKGLIADARVNQLKISPSNRLSRFIPDEYDDLMVSSVDESFFSEKPRLY